MFQAHDQKPQLNRETPSVASTEQACTEAWIAGEAASARSAVSFEHGKLVWMMLRTLLVIDLRDTGAEATGAVKKLHGKTALESLADVAPTLILSRSDVRKDCVAKAVATKEYAMRMVKL